MIAVNKGTSEHCCEKIQNSKTSSAWNFQIIHVNHIKWSSFFPSNLKNASNYLVYKVLRIINFTVTVICLFCFSLSMYCSKRITEWAVGTLKNIASNRNCDVEAGKAASGEDKGWRWAFASLKWLQNPSKAEVPMNETRAPHGCAVEKHLNNKVILRVPTQSYQIPLYLLFMFWMVELMSDCLNLLIILISFWIKRVKDFS